MSVMRGSTPLGEILVQIPVALLYRSTPEVLDNELQPA